MSDKTYTVNFYIDGTNRIVTTHKDAPTSKEAVAKAQASLRSTNAFQDSPQQHLKVHSVYEYDYLSP